MLELKNINKLYKSKYRKVKALDDVSISLPNEGFVLIVGESGSGKTTLLNMIAGLVKPTSGSIFYNGQDEKYFKKHALDNVSYIFQEYNLIDSLKIKDNFRLALSLCGKTCTEADIEAVLKKVNLGGILNSYPSELSGGQRQRVAIARALFIDAPIILADEPTGALDEENAKEVLNILKHISQSKLVVVVSHNLYLANDYADRIIKMELGKVVSDDGQKTSDTDITVPYQNKNGISLGYALTLGRKFFNLKTFKFWLAFLIMIFSFVILLVFTAVLFFDKANAYDRAVKNENIHFAVLSKYGLMEEGHGYYSEDFTEREIEVIKSNFDYTLRVMRSYRFQFNWKKSSGDIIFAMHGAMGINQTACEKFGFEIIGSLPKENEILLTVNQASNLGLTSQNYQDFTFQYEDLSFKISGLIDFPDFYSSIDFDEYAYFNDVYFAKKYKEVNGATGKMLVDSSNYKNIESTIATLKSIEAKRYEIDSLAYDSIQRMQIFVDSLVDVGFYVCLVFIIFASVLVINFIYSNVVDNKRDIKIIRTLGGKTADIFKIFFTQSLFLSAVTFMFAIIGYFAIANFLNIYIKEEFYIFVPILSLNAGKLATIILLILGLTTLATLIPILRIRNKK